MANALMSTYARQPVSFVKGRGALLWDLDDKQYIDALSGVAVCNLGHAHPAIAAAICQQATTLLHTSNHYGIPLQEELGAALNKHARMEKVFFCNSGAEANETAIKIARLYGHRKNIPLPTIIVAEQSFHGRTLATLSATGNPKIQAGFDPLVTGFARVPYGNLAAIRELARTHSNIVAVLVEPVQGEGGVNIPADDYLPGLRALCDHYGWLLMLDEIQTGMGRTGRWFAWQHSGAQPDVMTLAKALGNGVPIGACLARGAAAEVLQPGTHGSTFGGNPLACSAALAVIATLEREDIVTQAARLGERLLQGLRAALTGCPTVVEVRGVGLMVGIELTYPCASLVQQARERGVLINVTAEKVIRLLPPLIATDAQIDQIITVAATVVREFSAPRAA